MLLENTFSHIQIWSLYKRIDTFLEKKYGDLISSWKLTDQNYRDKLELLRSDFVILDQKIWRTTKEDIVETVKKSKNDLKDLLMYLDNLKNYTTGKEIKKQETKQESLSNYSSEWKYWELMYYSDSFEWKNTSNWNLFSQRFFSAAKCNVSLNKMIQVWLWEKSLIVKVNDRPNCSRFPNLIDLTTTAFDFFYDRYKWKQSWKFIELGYAPADYYKSYLSRDSFSDDSIVLRYWLPNTYVIWESIHIDWELSLWNRNLTLEIHTPSWKNISLSKKVERYFSYSYPLLEEGEYMIWFSWSEKNEKIYVLKGGTYDWKSFIKSDLKGVDKIEIIEDVLWEWVSAYRLLLKDDNYHMAEISNWKKTYYYSWIKDIIIPKDTIEEIGIWSDFWIKIKSSKTITNFSHDFYTEPIVIFDWSYRIAK